MSHEQSETVKRKDGRWINVYGRKLPKAGLQLPGTPDYPNVEEAEAAAVARSASFDKQPQHSNLYQGQELDPYQLEQLRADLEKWQRRLPQPGLSAEEQAARAAKGSIWNKMKRGAWRGMENLSRFGEGAAWLPIELLKAPGSIHEAMGGKPGFLEDVKRGAQNVQEELHHGTQFFQEMAGVPKEESALPTSERYIPTWVPELAGAFTQPGPYLSPIKKLLSKAAIKPALQGMGQMGAYGAGVSALQEFNKPADERDWWNVPKTAATMATVSPIFQRFAGAFERRGIQPGAPARPQLPPSTPRAIVPQRPTPPRPSPTPEARQITDYIDVPFSEVPPERPPIQLPYLEPPKVADTLAKGRPTGMRDTDFIPDQLAVNQPPRDPFLIKQPPPLPPVPKSLGDASLDVLAGDVRPSLVKPHDLLPPQLEVNQGPRTPYLIKQPTEFMGMTAPQTVARPPAPSPVAPVSENKAFGDSLLDFLRAKGGIQDQGGEIGRMEIPGKPFQRGLVKPEGMGLDTAAELAHEAGYLQERDIGALLQSIENEARGKPAFSPSQTDPALESQLYEQQFAKSREYRDPLDAEFMVVPEEPIHPADLPEYVLPPLEEAWGDPTTQLRRAPATFLGVQKAYKQSPELELFNLTEDIPGHPAGSTVVRQTLEQAGFEVPPPDPTPPLRESGGGLPNIAPLEGEVLPVATVQSIHDLADSKGIAWDNDRQFMDVTELVTGKRHLDKLDPGERGKLFDFLQTVEPETSVARSGQQSMDVPPPTVGERPLIGREVSPDDDAPLFNLGQREPAPEQPSLFGEHGGPAPESPAGQEAAAEVHQETQTDIDALTTIKNILNDERGSTHLGGGVGPIERVLTQRRFAEKHPQDFGPVYQKALDRFEWQAAQKHDLHQLGRPYFLLDPADRKIVDKLLRDRRRMRPVTIPPALQPAVNAVDRMMGSSYDLINDVRAVKGMPPMQHDPVYVPFARSGDYLTLATLPNGKKWVSAATTLREAEAMEKKLKAQFPGVNVLVKTTAHKKGDLPTLDFGTLALLEKAGIIDRADFEQAVSQFDLPPGFSAHMRNAQKILGESVDLLDPIERYIDGVTNYTARFLHDDEMKAMIETIKDPAVKQYAERYRDYLNTKPQEYSRLRGAVAVWDLALNIGSMFQNATQVPFVGGPVIESHIGKVKALQVFKDSLAAMLRPSQNDTHILQMAEREGHIRPINAEELFGARGTPGQELEMGSPYVQRQMEKGWLPAPIGKGIRKPLDFLAGGTEKLLAKGADLNLAIGQKLSYGMHRLTGSSAPVAADKARAAHPVLMQGFASIEEKNRQLAILLGYRTGESLGMNPAESYEFAKKISRDINYDYSPASRAQAFRGMGAPLGLFMTFQTEYMATISKLIRQQATSPGFKRFLGPATSAMLAFWSIAGLKGLPGVEDLDLYGPDPGMISENLPDWLYQGPASALTGRDISAKFKMGPRVPYDMLHGNFDASQIPIVQPFQNIAQGTGWFLESPMDAPSTQKYVERLLPPALRHTAQAGRWAGFGPAGDIEQGAVGTIKGHTPGPTDEGKREFYYPSTVDIAGKAASFTPLELSKQYTRGRIQQRMQQTARQDTTTMVNAAAHHLDRNGLGVPSPALQELQRKHPHTYAALMKAYNRKRSGAEKGSTEQIYRRKQEPKVIAD